MNCPYVPPAGVAVAPGAVGWKGCQSPFISAHGRT